MTPMRLDTILTNLEHDDEREELIGRIVGSLEHHEIVAALESIWSRVEPRIRGAYEDYLADCARIDAEAAADATCRRCGRPLDDDHDCRLR